MAEHTFRRVVPAKDGWRPPVPDRVLHLLASDSGGVNVVATSPNLTADEPDWRRIGCHSVSRGLPLFDRDSASGVAGLRCLVTAAASDEESYHRTESEPRPQGSARGTP